jgi:hypothetical protein
MLRGAVENVWEISTTNRAVAGRCAAGFQPPLRRVWVIRDRRGRSCTIVYVRFATESGQLAGVLLAEMRAALRLEAQRGHAGLVGVRTLHVLAFSTSYNRKFTMSLVDALVDRRIPRILLRRLLRRSCEAKAAAENPKASTKKRLFALPMAWLPLLTPETAGQLAPNRNPPSGRQGA